MKWILVALLLYAAPVQSQVKFGNDTLGFVLDTTYSSKSDPSKEWLFEVVPKQVVHSWWHEIASCEGLSPKDAFKGIHFIIVNEPSFGVIGLDLGAFWGYTLPTNDGGHIIFLAYPFAANKLILQHEMVHVLMRVNGFPPGHPDRFYKACNLDKPIV